MTNGWTRYISKTLYVNEETGEQLRTKDATDKSKWIITKTTKKTTYNEHKTKGYIEYVKQCRRQPQQKLNFG